MITVVAGIPRCGSSLMMRMLHRGGIEPYADNLYSYEAEDVLGLPSQTKWLDKAEGKAVKILEPLEYRPPKTRAYRFVVMTRDPIEQAKSQVKFARATGVDIAANQKTIRILAGSNERDTAALIKMIQGYPNAALLVISFEALILDPLEQALLVSDFCGGLHVSAMTAEVIDRLPQCLPYLLELEQINS